mmetsp:Transcript_19131/g.32860  ORF Transcript_19131/g.32860 Transcript_19131/m.32860 type:complete len:229 (+) Transcript_19131:163-849(+)|eukprot:CAMPEP_0183720558 /NCGR_PEP_ID=MMETSP0737-20130205/13135_1 /TAXON_ID=385413 /ORGANISM="Thalassiosira miniscula, Strain CCMP1093" /LENGTH=228 /DNA_ID=CAMNT_0025950435 /DNA_START=146 /DNA_END=835 /DNA_ORIENTATION=+
MFAQSYDPFRLDDSLHYRDPHLFADEKRKKQENARRQRMIDAERRRRSEVERMHQLEVKLRNEEYQREMEIQKHCHNLFSGTYSDEVETMFPLSSVYVSNSQDELKYNEHSQCSMITSPRTVAQDHGGLEAMKLRNKETVYHTAHSREPVKCSVPLLKTVSNLTDDNYQDCDIDETDPQLPHAIAIEVDGKEEEDFNSIDDQPTPDPLQSRLNHMALSDYKTENNNNY